MSQEESMVLDSEGPRDPAPRCCGGAEVASWKHSPLTLKDVLGTAGGIWMWIGPSMLVGG